MASRDPWPAQALVRVRRHALREHPAGLERVDQRSAVAPSIRRHGGGIGGDDGAQEVPERDAVGRAVIEAAGGDVEEVACRLRGFGRQASGEVRLEIAIAGTAGDRIQVARAAAVDVKEGVEHGTRHDRAALVDLRLGLQRGRVRGFEESLADPAFQADGISELRCDLQERVL